MKRLALVLLLFPSLFFGQNFLAETKPKTKKHFRKWMNPELNWVFKDSVISALCCVEYDDREGVFYDTVSVWTASLPETVRFSYYFNQEFSDHCDSIHIEFFCENSSINTLNDILKDSYPIRWRSLNKSTFMQHQTFGKLGEYYLTPIMELEYNDKEIVSISIWKKPLEKEEYDSLKELTRIKTSCPQ